MIQLSTPQKQQIVTAIFDKRKNFDGSDEQFSHSLGINSSVLSRLKNSKDFDGLIRDSKWVDLGYELNIDFSKRKWNIVRTDVFTMIEEEILFCKSNAKSMICVDNSDIGKTTTAKHLSKTLKNCFYVDMSQCAGKIEFIRTLAKNIGINPNQKIVELKSRIKFMLKALPDPVVLLDEAGDMRYETFLVCKELWNGTEGACGWYMIGADALRDWIERGKKNRKVGFYEMFNRYGATYNTITPDDNREKHAFYKKLITDVVKANLTNKANLNTIVNKALVQNTNSGEYSGLRRIESLILLNK